jgi:hypothetical protein
VQVPATSPKVGNVSWAVVDNAGELVVLNSALAVDALNTHSTIEITSTQNPHSALLSRSSMQLIVEYRILPNTDLNSSRCVMHIRSTFQSYAHCVTLVGFNRKVFLHFDIAILHSDTTNSSDGKVLIQYLPISSDDKEEKSMSFVNMQLEGTISAVDISSDVVVFLAEVDT